MSGIAGVVAFDGAPIDPRAARGMSDALAARGARESQWSDARALLIHRGNDANDASTSAHGVLASDRAPYVLTFAGRIDNAEELRRDLERDGRPFRHATDSEIVLRAYERWGQGCFSRLLGDFAFALWDASREALFCARDITGVRPFYFGHERQIFRFASEMPPIIRAMDRAPTPNEGMVGEYLSCAVSTANETLYREIHRLPPAHALVASQRGVSTFRYWEPPTSVRVRYAREDDYVAHFNEVFREAVRCRLRTSEGPIAISLSGGLDSSSVACVARAVRPDAELLACSLVFPGLECDEQPFIRDVVARCRLDAAQTTSTIPPWTYREHAERFLDFPGHPNGLTYLPLYELARARGARVVLTGVGGDDWLDGSTEVQRLADMLLEGRVREVVASAEYGDAGAIARLLARDALGRALPRSIEVGLMSLMRLRRRIVPAIPPWVPKAFARRVGLEERLRPAALRGHGFAIAAAHSGATMAWRAHAYEMQERIASHAGIELRHPFDDRRVAEFLMSVPPEIRGRRGESKWVMRRALSGMLPSSIHDRRDKAEFSYEFARALREASREEDAASLEVAERGWVDRHELRRAFGRYLRETSAESFRSPLAWKLWMTLGVEHWQRAQASRSRHACLR